MSATQWSLILSLLAAAATVAGGLAIVVPGLLDRGRLPHIIAFGAGFMLAAAFVKMIPESFELEPHAPVWILAGYVLAHLFEHTFTSHFHFGEETHTEHMISSATSLSAFIGLNLHALFDGISISAGFLIDPALGLFIALAVILHKLPEGVTMASVMIASGRSRPIALGSTVVLGIATIVGTVLMFALSPYRGVALALSAGIATYVAATDLIPELNQLKQMRFSFSAALGIACFFAVAWLLNSAGVGG